MGIHRTRSGNLRYPMELLFHIPGVLLEVHPSEHAESGRIQRWLAWMAWLAVLAEEMAMANMAEEDEVDVYHRPCPGASCGCSS